MEGSKYYFGWPAPNNAQKRQKFFSTKKLTYNEVERVLNNINSCSQTIWEKKHYPIIKDLSYFNKNNTKLRNVILKLIWDFWIFLTNFTSVADELDFYWLFNNNSKD